MNGILFLDTINSKGKKSVELYYEYLQKHNLYNDEDFIAEHQVKVPSLEYNFGGMTKTLKKYDSILVFESNKINFTNVFKLDKVDILNASELEMISNSHVNFYNNTDSCIENDKFFEFDFDFKFRKSSLEKRTYTETEKKYFTEYKAAIMMYDIYFESSETFRNSIKSHADVKPKIDSILLSLQNDQEKELTFLNVCKNKTTEVLIEKITNDLKPYLSKTNLVLVIKELQQKASTEGIKLGLTKKEMTENNLTVSTESEALYDENNYDLEKVLKFLENKYETLKKQKTMTRIDTVAEGQIDWKSSKPNYVNEGKYKFNCPLPLRGRQQFVCWKTEWVASNKSILDANGKKMVNEDGTPKLLPLYDSNGNPQFDDAGLPIMDGKWTKVPYNPKVAYNEEKPYYSKAKSNDNRTWGTFEEACAAADKYGYDGIGIQLGKGLIGIDIDHVIGANNELTEEAKDIVERANSYTEYSPSKTGLHILMFADMPENATKRHGNLEIYSEGRFFTLTGDTLDNVFRKITTKANGTTKLHEIHRDYMPQNKGINNKVDYKTLWADEENKVGLTTEQIIEKIIASGDKQSKQEYIYDYRTKSKVKNINYGTNVLKDLFDGNWEAHYPDQSTADAHFVRKVWFYTTSPKQVDEVIRDSGLYRDKWDNLHGQKTYGQSTIEFVIRTSGDTKYDPKAYAQGFKNNQTVKNNEGGMSQ